MCMSEMRVHSVSTPWVERVGERGIRRSRLVRALGTWSNTAWGSSLSGGSGAPTGSGFRLHRNLYSTYYAFAALTQRTGPSPRGAALTTAAAAERRQGPASRSLTGTHTTYTDGRGCHNDCRLPMGMATWPQTPSPTPPSPPPGTFDGKPALQTAAAPIARADAASLSQQRGPCAVGIAARFSAPCSMVRTHKSKKGIPSQYPLSPVRLCLVCLLTLASRLYLASNCRHARL